MCLEDDTNKHRHTVIIPIRQVQSRVTYLQSVCVISQFSSYTPRIHAEIVGMNLVIAPEVVGQCGHLDCFACGIRDGVVGGCGVEQLQLFFFGSPLLGIATSVVLSSRCL